ncbi:hypothetical protein NX059_004424 [Plenodomus lindquistii]|nr:hypothetical protein NX059_004424 [Plenodomus lindquistii]
MYRFADFVRSAINIVKRLVPMSDPVVPKEVVTKASRKRSRKPRTKAKNDTPEASSSKQKDANPAKSISNQLSTPQLKKDPSKPPAPTAKPPSTNDSNTKPKNTIKKKNPKHQANPSSKTVWLLKSTGATLHTLTSSSLLPTPTPVTSSTPTTLLCSYNWLSSGTAILVPGGPPKWTPPPLPLTIPSDSGLTFIDQNASRVPKYPFEPAFRAMAAMNPDVRLNDVDVVLNRNSLRKLLDFAAGKRQDPWRMGLCMVRDTLFITRNERKASMMIHNKGGAGYGHSFEKAFTTPGEGMDESSSHHRVVRYMLGGLSLAVRFEVDAYLEETNGEADGEGDKIGSGPAGADEDALKHLTDAMGKTSINASLTGADETPSPSVVPGSSSPHPPQQLHPIKPAKEATHVIPLGTPISSQTLAELKTSSTFKPVKAAIPQLWFGRTPHLITGIHGRGKFHKTQIVNVGAKFASWESADIHQERLRKMAGVLKELRRVVGGMEGGREAVLVLEEKGGNVRVLERRDGCGVLPADLLARFWGGEGSGL